MKSAHEARMNALKEKYQEQFNAFEKSKLIMNDSEKTFFKQMLDNKKVDINEQLSVVTAKRDGLTIDSQEWNDANELILELEKEREYNNFLIKKYNEAFAPPQEKETTVNKNKEPGLREQLLKSRVPPSSQAAGSSSTNTSWVHKNTRSATSGSPVSSVISGARAPKESSLHENAIPTTENSSSPSNLAPPPTPQPKEGRASTWTSTKPSVVVSTTKSTIPAPMSVPSVQDEKTKSSVVTKPGSKKLPPTNTQEIGYIATTVAAVNERSSKSAYEEVAQEVAMRIVEMNRNMFLNMQRERDKKFGKSEDSEFSTTKQTMNNAYVGNELAPIDPSEMTDILKIKSIIKHYSNYASQIGANSTHLQNFVVLSFNKMPLTQKNIMLKMWMNVAERLKLNKDYEGLAQVVGALKSVLSGKPNGNLPEAEIHKDLVLESKDKKLLDEYGALFEDGRFKDIRELMAKHISDQEQFIPMGSTITQDLDKFANMYSMWVGYVEPLSRENHDKKVKESQDPYKEKTFEQIVEERRKIIQEKGGIQQLHERLLKQKSTAQGSIDNIEKVVTKLPSQFIIKPESFFQKETSVQIAEFTHDKTATLSPTDLERRKGSIAVLPVNPMVEIENKINQSIKAIEFIDKQLEGLKSEKLDRKAINELKKQKLDFLNKLIGFEKDKFKQIAANDFVAQEKSLLNEQNYLNKAIEISTDISKEDKSYDKFRKQLSSDLILHSEHYSLFLDSRSAYNFENSIKGKEQMIDLMTQELKKASNVLLTKFGLPRDSEHTRQYQINLSNQIMRIDGYENHFKSSDLQYHLPIEIQTLRQDLRDVKDILALKENLTELMKRRNSVPPVISSDKYKADLEGIHTQANQILSKFSQKLGDKATQVLPMIEVLNDILKQSQAPAPSVLSITSEQRLRQSQSK